MTRYFSFFLHDQAQGDPLTTSDVDHSRFVRTVGAPTILVQQPQQPQPRIIQQRTVRVSLSRRSKNLQIFPPLSFCPCIHFIQIEILFSSHRPDKEWLIVMQQGHLACQPVVRVPNLYSGKQYSWPPSCQPVSQSLTSPPPTQRPNAISPLARTAGSSSDSESKSSSILQLSLPLDRRQVAGS